MVKMAIYIKNVSKNDWAVGIKMSWVEENRKINNRRWGDDYSVLENNHYQ